MSSRGKKILEKARELYKAKSTSLGEQETDSLDSPANLDSISNATSSSNVLPNFNNSDVGYNKDTDAYSLLSIYQDGSYCVVPISNQSKNFTLYPDYSENNVSSSSNPNTNEILTGIVDDPIIDNHSPSFTNITALLQNNLPCSKIPTSHEKESASVDGPNRMSTYLDPTTSKVKENRAEDKHCSVSFDIRLSSESESFSSDHSEYIPDDIGSSSESEPFRADHAEYFPEDDYNTLDGDKLESSTAKISDKSNSTLRNVGKEMDKIIPTSIPNTLKSDKEDKKEKKKWVKVKRSTDLCYFCDTEVLNFARHIVRNHSQECEVQKILSLTPKSLERKRLIEIIRKRGNHLRNLNSCVKPVKKSHVPGRDAADCIPCKHCLGYFRPGQLWRHVKRCPRNPGDKTKYSHKTDAQDLLVRHYAIDQRLKETVFPTMRPDKISLVAKKDTLICGYGSQYLTSHREKHHVNVCSRKMRELAKILIELRKLHPAIKNLFDALQPIYFDSFVTATKIVSGYDASNEEYKSSTFAMNISTSLKECCSLAIRLVLKKKNIGSTVNTAEMEANFNTFQQLLKDSWKFEVSSIAAACLNTRKWNKITIVPLASDLQLFRNHLLEKAKQAQQELKADPNNEKAYKLFLETIYCRSMLLNRKRGGEMQRILLQVYQYAPIQQSYEEFSDAITPTEKILIKKFKRVVIRGKRNRGVPVLFSMDVQKDIEVLIALRANFVNDSNKYLFPTLRSDTPITGYKVMQKHAKQSGAKNPNAITSTKLRKHLATMSQILELSPNDIEQLATFMGHTTNIHKQVYRLPDDIYQTAKIAKLLILMENGKAGQYKGKSLEEIEMDLEEEVTEDESDNEGNEDINEDILVQNPSTSSAPPPKKLKRVLIPWSIEQKKIINSYFQKNIRNKIALKKKDCENFKSIHQGIFDNKTWQQIKVYVQNKYSKNNV